MDATQALSRLGAPGAEPTGAGANGEGCPVGAVTTGVQCLVWWWFLGFLSVKELIKSVIQR